MQNCLVAFQLEFCKHETILLLPRIKSFATKSRNNWSQNNTQSLRTHTHTKLMSGKSAVNTYNELTLNN